MDISATGLIQMYFLRCTHLLVNIVQYIAYDESLSRTKIFEVSRDILDCTAWVLMISKTFKLSEQLLHGKQQCISSLKHLNLTLIEFGALGSCGRVGRVSLPC